MDRANHVTTIFVWEHKSVHYYIVKCACITRYNVQSHDHFPRPRM